MQVKFLLAGVMLPAAVRASMKVHFLRGSFVKQQIKLSGGSPCVNDDIVVTRNGVSIVQRRVEDGRFQRSLVFGNECATESKILCKSESPCKSDSISCSCDIDESAPLTSPYMQTMFDQLGSRCSETESRVLMLGLGGGELTQYLLHHCPGMHVDAVELNADVIAFAKSFLGVQELEQKFPGRLTIEQSDAFSSAKAHASISGGMYDAVLVDCFIGGGEVPPSCRSREFAETAWRNLKAEGVFLQNIWHYSSMNENVGHEFKEAKQRYNEVFHGSLDDILVPMPPRVRWVNVLRGTNTWKSKTPQA